VDNPNTEIQRFVEFVGGNTKAAEIFDCTSDMVRKLKVGERDFKPKYVRIMHGHNGFRLSFMRLFDL
jgi:hypothetical protein